ncbi:hypothetical protein [Oceanobacillus timonensis]|uniref:hypothetical protein n=1 Tax=Oceanobacillus timonensis TaxID=1926285 RepID=UPI0009BA370C|nr:hypothetical protein [Oceanobacillus timonensis]
MKYVNLIKLATVGAVFMVIFFFVLDYLMAGAITYRAITLSITGILISKGASWIFGWIEKQRMTYDWLEEQKRTQGRILEKME